MRPLRIAGGLLAAGGGALAWGVGVERRWYATRAEEMAVLRRPGRLRVLFFSDLHLAPGQEHRLAHLRDVALSCRPDIIVSGGDNLEHPDVIESVVRTHAEILDATGALGLAVLGAHDRYGPRRSNPASYLRGPSGGPGGAPLDTEALVKGLEEGGWQVMTNRSATLATPAGPVDIAGIDDPHIGRDDLDVPAAARTDPEAVLRLGLVHAPYRRALDAFDSARYDLALAGHTHGGQIAVPWWGAVVSNCDLPPAQAKGTSWQGADLRLHVSAGLGHSIYFPVRFACRPELSILDLVGRS